MPNGLIRLPVLLAALLATACSFRVVTPPARSGFLGSPGVLPEGESAYTAEGTVVGQLYSGYMQTGSLTYHRGIGRRNELQITPGFARVQDSSNLFSLSLDMKNGLEGTENGALTYGVGYLRNEFAQALSSQVGMLLGYENRYAVPTFSMMLLASLPFATRAVCGGKSDGNGQEVCVEPTFTVGARFGFSTEFKLPGGVSLIPSVGFAPMHSKTHSLKAAEAALGVSWSPK